MSGTLSGGVGRCGCRNGSSPCTGDKERRLLVWDKEQILLPGGDWSSQLRLAVECGIAGECGSYGHSQRLATWHDIHSLVPECRICLCTGFFCSRTAPQCCSSSWWLASSMDRSFWASNSNSLVHLLLSLVLFSTASRNGSWTTREFFSFLELRTPGSRGCVDEAEASGFCLLFQIFLQLVLPTAAFRAVSH